jgi:hypothetical protein
MKYKEEEKRETMKWKEEKREDNRITQVLKGWDKYL